MLADRFVTASRAPTYFAPTVTDVSTYALWLNPNLNLANSLSWLVLVRANRSIAQGDLAAAWSDLMAIHRWAHLLANADSGGGEDFTGQWFFLRAHHALQHLLQSPGIDLDLLRQTSLDLATLPEPAASREVRNRIDRYLLLEVWTLMANGTLDQDWFMSLTAPSPVMGRSVEDHRSGPIHANYFGDEGTFQFVTSERSAQPDQREAQNLIELDGFDMNRVLREVNAYCDWLAASAKFEDWRSVGRQLELYEGFVGIDKKTFAILRQRIGHALEHPAPEDAEYLTQHLGKMMAHLYLSSTVHQLRREFQQRALHRMSRIAVAIRIQDEVHGQLPDSLAALREVVPDLDLVDPFGDGESFRYVVDADQLGFALYSLNLDLDDDGGRSHLDRDSRDARSDRGDLVLRWQAPEVE